MKILLVPWMLLLLAVSLNTGHYIRDIEYDKPSVYQVGEGSSGVFEHPKPDQPTLREILYYHFIERPREEPVITARSFTNSHGYQFLEQPEEYYEKQHNENEHSGEKEYIGKDKDTKIGEEDPEIIKEAKPLTDEDVKEAYKTRSYLFDQARQRYAVKRMAVPDSLKRRRRQAEIQLPDAPSLSNKDDYVLPKTYGMNLNPEGGYVWNNLNKPSYYELGPSYGNNNEGQYESAETEENGAPSTENISPSQTSDSGSSEDIYVNSNRPSAMPLESESEKTNPEVVSDNPEAINESPETDSEVNPVEPSLRSDEAEPNESFANNPIGPEFNENPEPNSSVEPVADPQAETPISEEPAETIGESNENSESIPTGLPQPAESNGNPGYGNDHSQPEEINKNPRYGYGQSELEDPKPESSPEESFEGDNIKEIPVAPTLPPLNYDNLPDYIRDAISSTEKPTSYEQTDNPYINPQPSADDKKVLEDKMEGIFATMPPVEDIPKTYGMNLTSNGGRVWNDMVNPPVSYDVGSPNNPEEENKEEQTQAPTEQPEIREPENPIPEPAEPEKDQPNINLEEPNQEPDTHEEEDKPSEEPIPSEPEYEGEPEEPIANPNQGLPEPEPTQEPDTQESEETKPNEEPIPEPDNEGEPEEPIADPNQGLPEPEPNQEPDTHESEETKPIEEPITEPDNEGEPEESTPDPNEGLTEPEPNQEPDTHESEDTKPIEPVPEPENEGEPENPTADPNQDLPPDNEHKPQIPDNKQNPIEEPVQPEPVEPKPSEEPENPELIPEPGNEDNHEIEVPQPGTEEPSEETTEHIEEPENEPVEDITEEEIMSKLLKSEPFWKWLGEWTATYMELLEKHMRKIAIQEICKREKAGEQMCPVEDNPEDTGIIIKDDKIIVDGREIEMTHTDNLDSKLKGNHYNKHENKGTNGNKVEASTIYGNSVGNDKVTNVFIFTADKAEEVIDQVKPVNNSEVDFVIDDRIKEENKDEPKKEMSIEDESNAETSNVDDINKKLIDDDNKDSIKNEENIDLKPEVEAEDLNKGEEPANAKEDNKDLEGTSGETGEIDDEAKDESKLDSSEKDINNSKEYLEKK